MDNFTVFLQSYLSLVSPDGEYWHVIPTQAQWQPSPIFSSLHFHTCYCPGIVLPGMEHLIQHRWEIELDWIKTNSHLYFISSHSHLCHRHFQLLACFPVIPFLASVVLTPGTFLTCLRKLFLKRLIGRSFQLHCWNWNINGMIGLSTYDAFLTLTHLNMK